MMPTSPSSDGFEQNRARPVAENNAHRAIGVVGHRRIHVRPDHQHLLVLPRLDELHSGVQRVQKSRASGGHIEAPRVLDAQLVLHQAGRRRIHHVRRHRAHHDQVHFLQIEGMRLEQILHRRDRQIAGRHALVDEMALADPDPLHDPFVGGVDHLLQVGVGENARRQIGAKRADFGADRFGQ